MNKLCIQYQLSASEAMVAQLNASIAGSKAAIAAVNTSAVAGLAALTGVVDGLATTDASLPSITADATGPKHLMVNLSRSKLEELTGG